MFCVGEESTGQETALSGAMGSSGSKSCRRASAGRRFCVGEGGYCSGRGKGERGLEELPQGERREIVLRGDGGGEAAGDWSERKNGKFGLGDLPQGGRRGIVLRGEQRIGEAA